MKLLVLLTALPLLLLGVCSANAQRAPLQLEITHLRNTNGQVLVAIYQSEVGFPSTSQKAVFSQLVKVSGTSARVTVPWLEKGKYAAVALHDENSNVTLDANLIGYPKEGIAVSNGLKSKLRKPTFAESAFMHTSASTVQLKMNYY